MIDWNDFIQKSKYMNITQLAEYYNTSENYIRQKLGKKKIKAAKKKYLWNNPLLIQKVKELSEKKLNKKQIEKELNISPDTLNRILNRNNIILKTKKIRATKKEMICFLHTRFTIDSIAMLFNLSKQRIQQIYKEGNNENI